MKSSWRLSLLILSITLLWGYAWVLMKLSLAYMGPFTFSALRFVVGAIALLIVLFLSRIKPPPKKYYKHFIVVGLLQTTVLYLFLMYGLKFVGIGKSSVIAYSMPIWSSIFAFKYLGEKTSASKVIGLILGLVGLLAILGTDIWKSQSVGVIYGEIIMVIGAVAWGASNVYYRIKLSNVPQLQVSAYQMFFGSIGMVIAAFVLEWGEPIVINIHTIYYILFTGVLSSALAFTLWFYVLSKVDMVTSTISTLLVPVFSLFFGWFFFDEKLTLSVMIGAAFIIGGIIISQLKFRSRKRLS